MSDDILPPIGDEATPPPPPKHNPVEITGPLEDGVQKQRGYGVVVQDSTHVCTPACNHGQNTQPSANPHTHDDNCTHDEVKRVPAPEHANWKERFATFRKNMKSRFVDGVDPTHIIDDGHGGTKPFKFETRHKTGAVLGATCSLGVIIHGGMNIKRGMTGYEDSLQEKHGPSVVTSIVGASEVVGGLALLSRALSGRYMP